MAVWITDVVRSQISTGLCSTQPACGRICSCSGWCLATSLPEWSKSMNRVLVVPWSTAPTKSGMHSSLSSRWGGSRSLDFLLRGGASQRDRRQAPHPGLRLRASPGFLREPGLLDRTANVLDHLEPGVQHVSDEEVVD